MLTLLSSTIGNFHLFFSDCFERKAVGLDCEWLGPRIYQKYGKVLVITICTPQGYCALFRMNEFRKIPKCLKVNVFIIS